MDNFSLFAANAIVLSVIASAFLMIRTGQPQARYWKSWFWANVVLAGALVFFMFEPRLPDVVVVTVPNCLLVIGVGLRWQAARQFGGRPSLLRWVWGPSLAFVALCSVPWIFGSYGAVYTIVNIILAIQTVAVAHEFWRDRSDRLASRYGLAAVYAIMALSFAVRVAQGALIGDQMARHLPDDAMLTVHLGVALLFSAASGAFAIAIAYERGAVELRDAAMRDPLTRLHNRRAFEAHIREYLCNPGRKDFAIALFDIDHFKDINDRFGHAAGDQALRACAERCGRSLRREDFLARIGGEEFAAILPDVSAVQAFEIADGVREAVKASAFHVGGQSVMLTLSAGVCHSSTASGDFDEMMRSVDACLYGAKDNGRDRVEQLADQNLAELLCLRDRLHEPDGGLEAEYRRA